MEAMAPDEMDQDHRQKRGREKLEDTVQGQEIRELREEIRELREDIRELREEIRELRDDIKVKEAEMRGVEKEMTIASGTEVRKPLEAKLEFLRQQLISLRQEIGSRDQQIVSRDQQIVSLRQEISSVRSVQEAAASSGVGLQRLDRVMLTGNRLEGFRSRFSRRECSMRKGTVRGLCHLILEKGAVLMRAPPQTGKTSLLHLIMLDPESHQAFQDVYYISLAQLSERFTFDQIWESDVGEHPSFSDLQKTPKSSPEGKHKQQASPANTRPKLLLVDEGHVGFGQDLQLWHLLKSVQSGGKKHLRMLIVSAWGSHDCLQGSLYSPATPGNWGLDSVVGLWPTETTPVSLQLPVEEATELWGTWSRGVGLSDSIRDHIFDISDRQPGLLTHVMDWLSQAGLRPMNSEAKIREYLLSSDFYDSLSSLRSIMKLNEGIAQGKHAKCLREFLRVLLRDCEVTMNMLSVDAKEGAALALKWGQVTDCFVESKKFMKLPSRLHEIYFMKQLYQNQSSDVRCDGLPDFVMLVVERMNPGQLMNSVSRTVSNNRLNERQYQAEFYRAALTVLPSGSWLSPDVGKLLGAEGYIDFYLSEPYRWGIELMRDGNGLEAHLNRFMEGGKYRELVCNGHMEDYVIFDFTTKLSFKHRLDSDEHLIHVVFRDDFKTAVFSGSRINNGSCSIPVRGAGLGT